MKLAISFIGLGKMGFPMAGHLQQQFQNITVYNRSIEKTKRWANEYGGQVAPSLEKAVSNANVIITCVGNDEDLKNIAFDEKQGILANTKPGTIWIDHTTASYDMTRELYAQSKEKNIEFLDAPVTGGEIGAQKGQLSVMVGGDVETLELVKGWIIACYAKKITYMGFSGKGQLAKMANQICIGGIIQSLAESIKFMENAELDVKKMIEIISGGAAQSWQLENRAQTMHERDFDFGFAVRWMVKDIDYCLEMCRKNNLNLPLLKTIQENYIALAAQGDQYKDTSSLIVGLDELNKKTNNQNIISHNQDEPKNPKSE